MISRNVLFLIRKWRAGSWLPWAIIQQSTSACKQLRLKQVLKVQIQQNLPHIPTTAVPAPLMFSSLLSLRKRLKSRLSFCSLVMEVDRKAEKRKIYFSCQALTKPHWIASSSRCQAAAKRSTTFSPPLCLTWAGDWLLMPLSLQPSRVDKSICQRALYWSEYSLPMSEVWWDYISLCDTEDKRKFLGAFCNVSRDSAFCTQEDVGRTFLHWKTDTNQKRFIKCSERIKVFLNNKYVI